tara:strand:- start:10255 stop:12186 length:1932 start_codon:yes stop_codon:yes gene_type:complete
MAGAPLVPPPSSEEYNRYPRRQTSQSYVPAELKQRGRDVLNFVNAVDPIQGIMHGMSASGRAFDSDLSPEERRAAAIEAGLETAAPLMMMGVGALAKQPIKATLLDILTPTGAPAPASVDNIVDPSRREFMKGVAATGGIAAIAPDVFREALEKVPAAVKRVRPSGNLLDLAMGKIRALRKQRDVDKAGVNFDDEMIDEARGAIEKVDPSVFKDASDDAIEEILSVQYDSIYANQRIIPEHENYDVLVNEIKRRGMDTVKDENGVLKYPNASVFFDDMVDPILPLSERIPVALGKLNIDPSQNIIGDIDYNDPGRAFFDELIRRELAALLKKLRKEGVPEDQIEARIRQRKAQIEEKHSRKMAGGGEARNAGIGPFSPIARDMNRGPKGIARFASGGEAEKSGYFTRLRDAVMMTESSGNPNAVSKLERGDDAIGLMQARISTAMQPGYGVDTVFDIAEQMGFDVQTKDAATARRLLFDPEINMEFGSQYLQAMLNEFPVEEDALRAFNTGVGKMKKYIAGGRDLSTLTKQAIDYPVKVISALQGINPNEPREREAFNQAPTTASALMSQYDPATATSFMSNPQYYGGNLTPLNPMYAENTLPRPRSRPLALPEDRSLIEKYGLPGTMPEGGILNLANSAGPR